MSYRNHNHYGNNSNNNRFNNNSNHNGNNGADQFLNVPSGYDLPPHQQGAGVTTTTTSGPKPKTLHIAHRRSPSELTSLMIEQFNLQRQLEAVQAQQHQLLQQQQVSTSQAIPQQDQLAPPSSFSSTSHNRNSSSFGGSSAFGHFQMPSVQLPPPSTSPNLSTHPGINHHRRTSSGVDASNASGNSGHRRSQSNATGAAIGSFSMPLAPPFKAGSQQQQQPQLQQQQQSQSQSQSQAQAASNQALGHSRRHSLGLNEAKKAAAIVQSQRSSNSPSKLSTPSDLRGGSPESDVPPMQMPPPAFKFPATPPTSSDSNSSGSGIQRQPSHGRSRSMMTYGGAAASGGERSPQRSFQFPPRPHGSNEMAPPVPQFSSHDRRQSGHYRTNSRNDTNWRKASPNNTSLSFASQSLESTPSSQSTFIPGHRPGRSSFGGSISSLANYGGGQVQQGGGSARKSLFAPYLPQSSLPSLIAEGRLVTGTLRVNKKNRSDAYVSTDGLLDADVFICGSKDRNRALEGDIVAVELLVVDEVWSSKREKEEKKRRKDNSQSIHKLSAGSSLNDDLHNDASTTYNSTDNTNAKSNQGLSRKGSLKQRPTQKKNDDVEVEGQSLLLVEEEEISDEYKPLYAGHVVAIVDRIPGQLFSGTLGLLRPSQASKEKESNGNNNDDNKSNNNNSYQQRRPKIVWFKPTDKKVPLIAIPTEQAPKDFVENHEKYTGQLFVASIKRWPITSLHPFGTLISQLGPMEEASTEIDAILRDNNFLCDEYPLEGAAKDSDKLFADLPNIEEAFAGTTRRSFTNEYVISATQTGDTSDHAFHVKRLSSSKIELGVHISDVTFGIKQGSILDKKAKKRSHSVFLPQKTTHLLPSKINQLFSFKDNEQSLAISVVFIIETTSFEIDDIWIGESVVVPKQKITYSAIDSILNSSNPDGTSSVEGISNATADYIRTLSLISREFKRQRLEDHSLDTEPILPLFDQLDDERVNLALNILDASPSVALINELFHKANFTIAQMIFSKLGDRTLLRKHVTPTLQKLETYQKKISDLGVTLDTTSSATLQLSILNIEDDNIRKCVETLIIKCMNRGKYVIAGRADPESFPHYLFNLPLYTHFTSPLRRYADIMVHRQLKAVLNGKVDEYLDDIESLKMTADYCNFKKDCAKAAQEQAIHLLLSQTINEMSSSTGQLLCMGTVLQVYESSFDVLIPEFGIEKRVHGDQLPLTKAEFDKRNHVLELYWEKGVDSATFVPEDENDALSYRASIKNKYRAPALEVARQQDKSVIEGDNFLSDSLIEKLASFKISPPQLSLPTHLISVKPLIFDDKITSSAPTTPRENKFLKRPFDTGPRTFSSSIIVPSASGSTNIDNSNDKDEFGVLNAYLKDCKTRVENDNYIQEIRELQKVPILLRAEIGMALPCLTVRALNPFVNVK